MVIVEETRWSAGRRSHGDAAEAAQRTQQQVAAGLIETASRYRDGGTEGRKGRMGKGTGRKRRTKKRKEAMRGE